MVATAGDGARSAPRSPQCAPTQASCPGNGQRCPLVVPIVPDWLLDLLLPTTDRAATTQWLVAAVVFAGLLPVAFRRNREVGLLVTGIATCTLAWFLIRMAH